MSSLRSEHARADTQRPIRWLLNGAGVDALAANPEVSGILVGARPYVMRGPRVTRVVPEWNAISFVSFAKLDALRNGLQNGKVGPDIRAVMYDYEKWQFTPEEEQRDSAHYVKQAADLVHARGLEFLTAPALNLVTAMEPGSGGRSSFANARQYRGPDGMADGQRRDFADAEPEGGAGGMPVQNGERRYEAYLRLGIAATAARYADVFDIQAQGFERNPERYADFVRRAAAQARQANPRVVVLAGISTQPSGQDVSADDILNAIAATRDVVDGYWFNIPQPSEYCPRCREFRPDIAIEVMRRVAAQ
jgi:hypothetical protein